MEPIYRKKCIDRKLVELLAEIISDDSLPIHMDIGVSRNGMAEVLFSFAPEDEPEYLKLIDDVVGTLYSF